MCKIHDAAKEQISDIPGRYEKYRFLRQLSDIILQVEKELGIGRLGIIGATCEAQLVDPLHPQVQRWPEFVFALAKLFPARRRKSNT